MTDWSALKVVELKEELKQRGLPVAGKKVELIARLEKHDEEQAKAEVEAPSEEQVQEEAEQGHVEAKPSQEQEQETETQRNEEKEEEGKVKASNGGDLSRGAEHEIEEATETIPAPDPTMSTKEEGDDASRGKSSKLPVGEAGFNEERRENGNKIPNVEEALLQETTQRDGPSEEPLQEEKGNFTQHDGAGGVDEQKENDFEIEGEAGEAEKDQDEYRKGIKRNADDGTLQGGRESPTAHAIKRVKTDELNEPISTGANVAMVSSKEDEESKSVGSRALCIAGFVRPFTLTKARELLSEHGNLVGMWMPTIKNVAWCIYETRSQALACKAAVHGLQWPAGSPKRLQVVSVPLVQAETVIRDGTSDEFSVERTSDDTPEDEVMPETVPFPDEMGYAERRRSVLQARGVDDRGRHYHDENGEEVLDLREIINRRTSLSTKNQHGDKEDRIEHRLGKDTRRESMQDKDANAIDKTFHRTRTQPHIYWLPVDENKAAERRHAREAIRRY